jgi:hypothetical protein
MSKTKKRMKLKLIYLLIIMSTSLNAQELIYENGIYSEKPNKKDTSNLKYTLDNKIYIHNRTINYDYYFLLENDTTKYKFRNLEESKYSLCSKYDCDSEIIDKIKLEVNDRLFLFDFDSTYSQTVISYYYLSNNNNILKKESTGIIENRKNTWIHPPRNFDFKILEINPFPFISFEEDNWNWTLEIGDIWGSEKWKTWKGIINVNYKYKNIGKTKIMTKLGEVECTVTESEANSILGSTFLKSFYNEKYGFVKLEYTNIDNSKLIYEIEKFL